ncbi:CpaD family pilus assembly lipoprotein [Sphingomonas naphthae]|uniref:CpaD family pilus assembly lipoprotein n=1 Tax=Sphingomonas naphthae TaxID=1813468 RepID=A0ABY7TFZ3_9SPHN|nr:CpaD family pilus assembly lipoprotein [Sphingomonas naphthae]WCT72151.1 CpaD family pilus assembly lipoprotein [Sphingomonas naphthae]
MKPLPFLLLAGALSLGGCMGTENRGVDSVHVPMVTRTATGAVASVPGCPDWSRPVGTELTSSTTSDYGCATRSNLAAMIADPMDLITPKSSTATDPYVAAKGIKSWRDTPASGSKGLEKVTTGASK